MKSLNQKSTRAMAEVSLSRGGGVETEKWKLRQQNDRRHKMGELFGFRSWEKKQVKVVQTGYCIGGERLISLLQFRPE